MSARLKRVAVYGEGLRSTLSPAITAQRRVNVYLEVRRDGDRTSITGIGTPGLRLLFNASTPLSQPVRGMIGNDTALYLVAGNQVTSNAANGTILSSGTIGTSSGRVELALNPTQVMLVDGSAGYLFNPSTGAITPIGGAFPNGARTCVQCNGFGVAEAPGTNQFFVSNFNDFATWNGLSFAAATQAVDGIQAVDQLGGLLIPFSAGHLEFWQNAGLTQEPFVYIQNSASMYGLAAVGGRCHAGEALAFLARTNGGSFMNSTGSYQICLIKGYRCEPISTPDIDDILQDIARNSRLDDCTAYSWQIRNHAFAQFNFPSADRTLTYDLKEGIWLEMQSGVSPNYTTRHLGNYAAQAFKQAYVADWSSGNVYTFDPTVYTDNGNVLLREIVTRCAVEDFNTFKIPRVLLDMSTGVGSGQPGDQTYDPMLSMAIARDSRTYGPERLVRLGKVGQYPTRVTTRRWGRVQTTANLRIRMTDAVPFVMNSLAYHVSGNVPAGASAPARGRR